MPIITIYPDTDWAGLYRSWSESAYYIAREGSTLRQSDREVGQAFSSTPAGFICYQYCVRFRLESLGGNVLTAVNLAATAVDYSDTDFYCEARPYDAWIPGANLGAYPLYARADTDGGWPSMFTSEAAFLSAIDTPEKRAALSNRLRLNLSSSRQRMNLMSYGAEYVRLYDVRLIGTTAGGYSITCHVRVGTAPVALASSMASLVGVSTRATCRARAHIPQPAASSVRAYDFTRAFRGILPGRVATSAKLDGLDTLSLEIPWRYGRMDGTTDDRTDMVTQGWYLEHRGHWYRVTQFSPDVAGNSMPVTALSAEMDLDRFQTNYGQVPLSMRSHTPSEIMEAVFGGQPECDWYNGIFALLDDAGFPLGWTPDDGESWTVYAPDGEATMSTTTDASIESEGMRHTAGAEIKPVFDVYVGAGFAGIVEAVVSWQNALGVESHSDTITATTSAGGWATVEAPSWLSVRNERCKLTLSVRNNAEGIEVRFRRVRFLQNEPACGWSYYGSMDYREPAVPYSDPLFGRYGAWVTDSVNEWIQSSTAGDTLGRQFTGDTVTINFADGGPAAAVRILVDGVTRETNLAVSSAVSITIGDLDRYRPHTLEIVVVAGTVKVTGLTLSSENRIAVTWHKLGLYQATLALQDMVGGELEWDTREMVCHHTPTRGDDVTAMGLVWLREGSNIATFVPTEDWSSLANRGHGDGYGDGAFQLGCVVDADVVDEDGYTSQERFGVIRFSHSNKELSNMGSLAMETLQEANRRALPVRSYRSTIPDQYAAYLEPGDTCRVTHSVLGGTKDLRVLQVDRASGSDTATVLWGTRVTATNAASQYGVLKRRVDQLLRAY